MSQAQSNNQLFAVISLSLDRLNNINNTLGRNTGDLLLRSAAQRLATCIGDTNVLSRFGSNKFAILQPNLTSVNDAITLSQKILNTLSKPVLLDGNVVRTGSSIGIAIYPSDCTDSDCQARDVLKLDFHFNASFTALNLGKFDAHHQHMGQEPFVFSMASVKRRALNHHLLERFIANLDLEPSVIKSHPNYSTLCDYGTIAS